MFKTGKLSQPHVYKVEGIGEDMMCGAMDLSVLDDVRQVNDAQAFAMARRLAREEGIFAGGSSGAAVHVAVQLARELGKGKTIVVLLPDSGSSYISKFFSDEWMRDNGFLEGAEPASGHREGRARPRRGEVIGARKTDKVETVVKQMKEHGISQMPVVDEAGRAVGMIHEYDLLNFLIEGQHRLGGGRAARRSRCRASSAPTRRSSAARGLQRRQRGGGEGGREASRHRHQDRPHRVPGRAAEVGSVGAARGGTSAAAAMETWTTRSTRIETLAIHAGQRPIRRPARS